ncbi:MAG: hypothetical protein JWN70_2759 [Planctomycetaceae bacterium]|nr:hypothetical protein [Planctomycetaceae bacterium]
MSCVVFVIVELRQCTQIRVESAWILGSTAQSVGRRTESKPWTEDVRNAVDSTRERTGCSTQGTTISRCAEIAIGEHQSPGWCSQGLLIR